MNRFLIMFVLLSLASCKTLPYAQPSASPENEKQPAAATITMQETQPIKDVTSEVMFIDLSGFDEDLTSNLSARNRNIVVVAPAKFSLNNIPKRLEKWLSAVKESGGKVQAKGVEKPGMATRGILGALIDITVSAVKAKQVSDQLETVGNYNALLTYDKQTGQVSNVLFYHR